LLGSKKDELEKELAKCRVQIVNKLDKLNDEHINRSLNLKNEDQYGQKLQLCDMEDS
jgi:hypothetical protein